MHYNSQCSCFGPPSLKLRRAKTAKGPEHRGAGAFCFWCARYSPRVGGKALERYSRARSYSFTARAIVAFRSAPFGRLFTLRCAFEGPRKRIVRASVNAIVEFVQRLCKVGERCEV
jgi:hypothetical protein